MPSGIARMKARVDEMQRNADDQARRQIRNEPPPTQGPRDRKKKRKK